MVQQITIHFGALNAFALTAKCARSDGLSCQALSRNRALAINLTHGLINDLLAIGVHESLSGARVVALRCPAKCPNAHAHGLLALLQAHADG